MAFSKCVTSMPGWAVWAVWGTQSTAPASLTMEIKQSWSDTTPAPSPPLCLTDSKPPIEATGWKGAILHVAPFSALPCQSLCVFRMKRERRLGKYGSFWKGQVWYLTQYAFAQEACPTKSIHKPGKSSTNTFLCGGEERVLQIRGCLT